MRSNQTFDGVAPLARQWAIRCGMSYIVVKTIKGRQYRYEQRTYREGGKVRTKAIYLGPVDGGVRRKGLRERIGEFIELNLAHDPALPDEEAMLRQYNEQLEREAQERARLLADLHERYGLRLNPDEPPPTTPQEKAPSGEKGAAAASTPTPA